MNRLDRFNALDLVSPEVAYKAFEWQVDLVQLRNPVSGDPIPYYATIRRDTQKVLQAGLSKDYRVIQNGDLIDQAKTFLACLGGVAGIGQYWSIGGGESNTIQIIGAPYLVAGNPSDENYPVYTISNDHTGSRSTMVTAGVFRKICKNGVSVRQGKAAIVTISHRGDIEGKIRSTHEALSLQIRQQKVIREIFEHLAKTRIQEQIVKDFLAEYLPEDKETRSTAKKRALIADIFDDADGGRIERDTAYNLFQSITRHSNHYSTVRPRQDSGTSPEAARLQSIYQGRINEDANQALETIIRLTEQEWAIDSIIRQVESEPISQAATVSVEDVLAGMGV